MKEIQKAMLRLINRRQVHVNPGVKPYDPQAKHKAQMSETWEDVEVKDDKAKITKKEPQHDLTLNINKIQLHEEEELLDEVVPQPIITIQIGNEQKLVKVLIDTGLDCNTISQDLFQ